MSNEKLTRLIFHFHDIFDVIPLTCVILLVSQYQCYNMVQEKFMSQKKFDVVAFGEILIDFTFAGKNADGKNIYEENPGGGTGNCVGAIAKLGGKSAFIGMTGRDSFGEDIRAALSAINVDIEGMRYSDKQHTTLAFVNLDTTGERHFSFCRNPGADTQFSTDDLDKGLLHDTKFFHIGSLSLTDEPARTTTYEAIKTVKESGGFISYDPNWRESLWRAFTHENALSLIKSILPLADVIKISEEESILLFGKDISPENAAQKLLDYGARLALVTLGAKGVHYAAKVNGTKFEATLATPNVNVVDTTGAGDSFTGGTLYRITRRANPFEFTKAQIEDDLMFANAVASLCVTKRGALPALPTLAEVETFMKKQNIVKN